MRVAAVAEPEATVIAVRAGDEDVFVYRYLSDLSPLGLFVPQAEPLEIGAPVRVTLGPMRLDGVVAWRNPAGSQTPGVGVRLADLDDERLDELFTFVRAVAYLPDDPDA